MKEVIIFCESYPQIKLALYLLTQNISNCPVTVVTTGNHDLFRFFQFVNEKLFQNSHSVIYITPYLARFAKTDNKIKKAIFIIPDTIETKNQLSDTYRRYFTSLKDADIYFFSRCFNPGNFYMLKKLSQNNRLIFIPEQSYDAVTIKQISPESLTEFLFLAWSKIVYGHEITMGKHPLGQYTTIIPDRFINNSVDKIINRQEREDLLKYFKLNQLMLFDASKFDVIYFHDNLVEYDYVTDIKSYMKILSDVFSILRRYFPEKKMAYKFHPNSKEGRDSIKIGTELPDFIPAECLNNEKVKVYLGISSMILANVEQGSAISLIDLIPFTTPYIRQQLKEALIKWRPDRIIFPKSMDDFEKILSDIPKAIPD